MSKDYQMQLPLVSVVMPAFNAAATLIDAVNSVLSQSMGDLELIICNDASTDDTRRILSTITDGRVKIIHNDLNMGEGSAREHAIQEATGSWIAVIDADDTWGVERLSVLLESADVSEKAMIFDDIMECHDTPSGLVPWHPMRGQNAFGGNGHDPVVVPIADFVCSKRLLIKPLMPRGHLRQCHITHSNRSFGADTEYFLSLMANGFSLRFVPQPLYNYRITPGSASGNRNRNTLLRAVLENAADQFAHDPGVQAALRNKIAMVARDEDYMPFVWALKQGHLLKSLQLAFRSPWLVSEFVRNLPKSIYYNMHRLFHHGRVRGIQ
jgi:succinoglycan biosynthesis protein ExoO